MFERFTDRARKVMALCNQEAQRFNHEQIGPEHILLGIVREGSGTSSKMLESLSIDPRKVRLEIEKLIKSGPDLVTMGKLPQSVTAKLTLELAISEARKFEHNYVGTEHLLLGCAMVGDDIATPVLVSLGATPDRLRETLKQLMASWGTTATTNSDTAAIVQFTSACVNQPLAVELLNFYLAHRDKFDQSERTAVLEAVKQAASK